MNRRSGWLGAAIVGSIPAFFLFLILKKVNKTFSFKNVQACVYRFAHPGDYFTAHRIKLVDYENFWQKCTTCHLQGSHLWKTLEKVCVNPRQWVLPKIPGNKSRQLKQPQNKICFDQWRKTPLLNEVKERSRITRKETGANVWVWFHRTHRSARSLAHVA